MPNDSLGIKISETMTFDDKIYFNFSPEKSIDISDLIDHLQGLQRIGKKIPLLLERIYEANDIRGVSVRLVDININELKRGSLEDSIKFILEFFFTEEQREGLRRMNAGVKIASLVGLLAAGYAMKSCTAPSLMTNTNGIQQTFAINISSDFNIPEEKLTPVIEKTFEKPSLTDKRAAVGFLRLAKKNGGNVSLSSSDEVCIPEDFISQVPSSVEPQNATEHVEFIENTDIKLRALDMDNPEKGWAAIIPIVLPEHRIKLEISPDIDRTHLARLDISGDVEVYYKISPEGSKKPIKAVLTRISQ